MVVILIMDRLLSPKTAKTLLLPNPELMIAGSICNRNLYVRGKTDKRAILAVDGTMIIIIGRWVCRRRKGNAVETDGRGTDDL